MMNFICKHQPLFHHKLTPKITYHVENNLKNFLKQLFLNLVVLMSIMKRNMNMNFKHVKQQFQIQI